MPPELFVNFNKQFRWCKTGKDEFGLDWRKGPFSVEHAMEGIVEVARQTQEKMASSNMSRKKRVELHSNSLHAIQMIINNCVERFLVDAGDYENNTPSEEEWRNLTEHFASLKVTVQNRKPPYIF